MLHITHSLQHRVTENCLQVRSVCNVTTISPQGLFTKCAFATSLRRRSSEIGGNNWMINVLRSIYAASFITNSLSFKKSTFKVAGTIPGMCQVIMSILVTWVITLSSRVPRRKSRTTLTVCSGALSHVNRCVSLGFPVARICGIKW